MTGTDLTLENILKAFDVNVNLDLIPGPLKESGFYGRTIFCYSAALQG